MPFNHVIDGVTKNNSSPDHAESGELGHAYLM